MKAKRPVWHPPAPITVQITGLLRNQVADALLDKAIAYEEQEGRLKRKTSTSGYWLKWAAELRELARKIRDDAPIGGYDK